jgi:hypothetical protein
VEEKNSIWLRKLTKKGVSLLNKNVIMFAFFLFLAFIFWYLNSLSKEIKDDFKFSASFINVPKGRIISDDPPSKLILEIRGQGYSLLKYKFSTNRNKLLVDLSKVSFKRIPYAKPTRYFVISSGLISSFKRQLGNGFEIISIKPDTIFLNFNFIENAQDKKAQ